MDVNDYLLEGGDSDWSGLLADWHWILPPRFNLWLANRFGDLFLVLPDGSVAMLDTGAGTLRRIATSREDFDARLRQDNNAAEWLMMPLVDGCVAAGMIPGPGHCYGFVKPPALGGEYSVDNTEVVDLYTHYSVLGQLHAQIWESQAARAAEQGADGEADA